MPLIIVGYGDFEDYRVKELPMDMLEQLAARYPLVLPDDYSPEYDDLVITLAIHAEIDRRRGGAAQEAHVPSRRELAQLIIKRGFQQASKLHHPDADGQHVAQVRLAQVRDELLENSTNIPDDRPDSLIMIPAPRQGPDARPRAASVNDWDFNDDDVPF
ncbi:MAG: hypothetical protein JO340_07010 [Acidobacteriaceae bacterium]|nr:hypothetical protein [Acidobacteriaceae bacterium]